MVRFIGRLRNALGRRKLMRQYMTNPHSQFRCRSSWREAAP
jgi:hypothetical protein